jgi:2-haloacid dehalogenase
LLDFKEFDLLTFDCYGTLIDWESGILDAVRPVLDRHGVEVGDEEVLELYARTETKHEQGDYVRYEVLLKLVMTEMSLRLGVDVDPGEVECIARSLGSWPPFADTVPALEALKTRYKLAVVSNIDDALFEKTARHLQVPFDWVVTAQQVGAYKPSKQVFETAIARFDLPRERILHVAQSLYHDIVPARELGLSTVWVNRRHGRPGHGATPPADAKPDVEVADLQSLVKIMAL